MKKNDRINLDVISGISDKIIDEVTDMKIVLSKRLSKASSKVRKKVMAIGGIAASLALLFSLLIVVIIPLMRSNVPVYRGMTIRRESTVAASEMAYSKAGYNMTLGTYAKSMAKFSRSAKGNIQQLSHSIKDIVGIEVAGQEGVQYYVRPGETFIIEIHIDNPKDYEIQSFTLNGSKYANYMFKEGSTMELLLLEVTAPMTSGYTKYTIDAIKYIDGTEIKDVDMSKGNKSVGVGVSHTAEPIANVRSENISTTSAVLDINITDAQSVIGEGELSVYLSDGESIVASKPLTVGDNTVVFDNLKMSKTYEYGVVAVFDMIDGNGMQARWLTTRELTTLSAYGISNASVTKDSISFDVLKTGENGRVTAVSLYDANTDELVYKGEADCRAFSNLLSGHKYNIYVDFTYILNGEEITNSVAYEGITTIAKIAPTVLFGDMNVTDSSVSGQYDVIDVDLICQITSVDIYKGSTLVANNSSKELNFTGLEYYTDYKAVISYSYDLNDGNGKQSDIVACDIETWPYLAVTACSVINNGEVTEGDTVFLQLNIENPNKAVCQSVVVNGKTCEVVGSSTEAVLVCKLLIDNTFEGGNTDLTVEKLTLELDGKTYTAEPKENNTVSIFVNGKIEVKEAGMVVYKDGEYVDAAYIFPSEQAYLMVTLQNKTGYTVEAICVDGNALTSTRIDDEHYLVEVPKSNTFGTRSYEITEVKYIQSNTQKTISADISCRAFFLESDDINYISNSEELLNMNNGAKYYELTGNIDLSGIQWHGKELYGVFNGKGYSVQNMSFVGSLTDSNAGNGIGLFSSSEGVIKDLHMEGARLIVSLGSDEFETNIGGIVGSSKRTVFVNCSVDKNSIISLQLLEGHGTFYGVGGLVGCSGTDIFVNCRNYSSVSGDHRVGGIVGYYASYGGDSLVGGFTQCANYGTVVGKQEVGGIVGLHEQGNCVYENCANYGQIKGDEYVGGIVANVNGSAYGKVYIRNCLNVGDLSGSSLGGIVQSAGQSSIIGCLSIGNRLYGEIDTHSVCENSYTLGENVTAEQLNSKEFYTGVLGFDETAWNFAELDILNGKYPILK